MEEKAEYYTTISIGSSDRDELKEACKKMKIKQQEFIPLALKFFKKTGLSIHDYEGVLNAQVKKSENRIIGFLKTQDKDISTIESRLIEELAIIKKNQFAIVDRLTKLMQ